MSFIWIWWWAAIPIAINLISVAPQHASEWTPVLAVSVCVGFVSGLSAPILIHRVFHGTPGLWKWLACGMGATALSINLFNALEGTSRLGMARGATDRVLIDQREALSTRSAHLTNTATDLKKQSQGDPPDAIKALIEKLKLDPVYRRSRNCENATVEDSIALCQQIESAKVRLAAAVRLDEVETERRQIWSRLTNMETRPQTSEPGLDAMAATTGLERETLRTLRDVWTAIAVELVCAFMPAFLCMGAPAAREPRAPPIMSEKHNGVPDEVDPLVRRWASERLRKVKGSEIRGGELQNDFAAWCRTHGEGLPKAWKKAASDGLQALGYTKRVGAYTVYQDVKFASIQLKVVNIQGKGK